MLLTCPDQYEDRLTEAGRNLELVEPLCGIKPPPGLVVVEPPADPPGPVPKDALIAAYPVGRTIDSFAILDVSGSGTNKQWGLKGHVSFVYVYQVVLETRVVENRGTAVVFEQYFKDVVQLRADSDLLELQLDLPESPILTVLMEAADESLHGVPLYILVKKLAAIVNVVDPRGKRTLTTFGKWLKTHGKDLSPDDVVEMVAQFDKLSGFKVQYEYVSGLGVVKVEPKNDAPINQAELVELAQSTSLLMDYFVARAAEAEPGETHALRTQDIGGMLNLGRRARLSGQIDVRRSDQEADQHVGTAIINVIGGEIDVSSQLNGVKHSAKLTPTSGHIRYSPKDQLVEHAEIAWDGRLDFLSQDHLLFGTERATDVKIRTIYDAQPGRETAHERRQ